MTKCNVLIVDDEPAARYGMQKALKQGPYTLFEAENGEQALQKILEINPEIVICDINMPLMNGMELLKNIQINETIQQKPLVIVVTAYGTERIAVEAMKNGAYDYLTKPYDIEELRLILKKAWEKIKLENENKILKQRLTSSLSTEIIGESDQIKSVLSLVDKVASTDATVLLTGQSGTGKELVARTIHQQSHRRDKPFITMNCAAIPNDLVESELFGHEKGAFTGATVQRQGKFETANGGTLFLDEIADMSLETQAKILRVLEDKTITRLGGKDVIKTDVRLVSATNKNLVKEIESNNFREDLYYRIKVVEIKLPSLQERKSDIPLLVDHFIKMFADKHQKSVRGFKSAAIQSLIRYNWPGNVRQLLHVVEQCIVLSDSDYIKIEHIPNEITDSLETVSAPLLDSSFSFTKAKKEAIQKFESNIIENALQRTNGNITQAATLLKIKRQFLQQKINQLGILADNYR